jgi:hypothetical protein
LPPVTFCSALTSGVTDSEISEDGAILAGTGSAGTVTGLFVPGWEVAHAAMDTERIIRKQNPAEAARFSRILAISVVLFLLHE